MSGKPSGAEVIKAGSQALRGSIAEEIVAAEARGGLSEGAYTLLKFHGTYEQFDRDSATERKQRGEDKDWSFMVRVRAPAGRLTATQWLALDSLADTHADGTLRLTTRQGVQFHGIIRQALKPSIAAIHDALLTTLAACGDVVRNVITTAAPRGDAIHARLEAEAFRLSSELLPRTRAHHEIFLDEEAVGAPEDEPLYGPTYLPRKFKIALAHPDDNTPDVLANDLGFVALNEGDRITGWIVTIGGGMGMTHNKPSTYPRLADAICVIGPDDVLETAKAVVRLSRDHGDRSDRKHARLKYVVAERGVAWVRDRLAADLGRALPPAPRLPRFRVPELLGWHEQGDGRLWLGLPVAAGRVAGSLRAALREVMARFAPRPIVTAQQDLLLADITASDRAAVELLLRSHGVTFAEDLSPLARWSLACVALPTCGQSLAEGERVHAPIVADVEAALTRHGLAGERISLRLTGCPNGCARPYAGDIGVVGRAPGLYTLFVGGDFEGTRLSFALADKVPQARIAAQLEPLFVAWGAGRLDGEGFGDFCARIGQDAAHAVLAGQAAA
ncbi:NADPH-dependent assimilatory sulfite reductase hemoprotein subunit [Roseomonas sp. CAU 1739]|uniref:NADPH-dependent assimilatory sulfite reductase hemoprotein subunit n=1 Tax=Roseomonas sp. CAU 1739 TaxID=3140364 RepID=UPI00325AFFAD